MSGGRIYCSAKSFTGSSMVSESFDLKILLFIVLGIIAIYR